MQKSTRSTAAAFIAVMIAALMLAPLGAAQDVTFKNTSASVKGVRPGLEGTELSVTINYAFDNQAASLGTAEKTTALVKMDSSCSNPNVFVTGPGVIAVNFQPGESTKDANAKFDISATRDAPGLTQIQCKLTATPQALNTAGANQGGSEKAIDHNFNVIVDYYGAMSVNLATSIVGAAPYKDVPFNLEFTNFGNANTRVKFSIANPEEDKPVGEKWEYNLPTDLVVGAIPKGGDNTASSTFQVSTPYRTGWNNEIGSYFLTMQTEALDDPSQKGNTMTASLLIRVRGVYVPGFEAVAVAGSLLGALAIARRRE